MIASYPLRRFQLWEFRVSHGSLLIRSPRGLEQETNIDIVFVGVEFVSLPRHFDGLDLRLASNEEVIRLAETVGRAKSGTIFAITTGRSTYYVDAVQASTDVNTNEIFSSPFDLY